MWNLLALTTLAVAQETGSPCEGPASSADLLGAMEVAENAWSMADAEGFKAANVAIASLVPCVNEPITRATAARIHRMNGLNSFLARDDASMDLSFAASRYVQPGFVWPADLVPVDHPVLEAYVASPLDDPKIEATLPPKEGASWFDGRESLDRPTAWPTLHQHLSGEGTVLGTWLLWPDDAVPEYPRRVNAPAGDDARGIRTPLLVGAAGGYVLAGLLYGLAGASNATYHSGTVLDPAELDRLQRATNTRYWGAVGFAGASTATTIGGFAFARW